MKKFLILLAILIPFQIYATEQQPSLEERVSKIESFSGTLEKTQKIYDYYNLFIVVFLALGGVFSYFGIQLLAIKDKFNDKLKRLDSDIQTNSFLTEIEKFRISCKNFLSLSSGDGKSSIFLDFDPYIAQVGRGLNDIYENLNKESNIDKYLLVDDLLALGDANYHNKDFDAALGFYHLALAKSKFNPQIYYNVAFSYLEKRLQFDKSVDNNKERENFKRAINYGEFDFKNYIGLAISLANADKKDREDDMDIIKKNLDNAIGLDSNLAKNMIKQYYSQGYFDGVKDLIAGYLT